MVRPYFRGRDLLIAVYAGVFILQAIMPLHEIGSDCTKLAILHYTADDKHPLWSRSVGQMVATDTARVQIA